MRWEIADSSTVYCALCVKSAAKKYRPHLSNYANSFCARRGTPRGTRTRRAHTLETHTSHDSRESTHIQVTAHRHTRLYNPLHTRARGPAATREPRLTEPKSIRRHTLAPRPAVGACGHWSACGLRDCHVSETTALQYTVPTYTVLSRVRTSDTARVHVGLAPHPRLIVRRRPLLHATLRTHAPPVTRSASASSDPCLQREGPLPTHPTLVVSIRVQVHAGAVARLELGDELLL